MKCLILGGAGFIGSHITDVLVEHGHSVRIFERPNIDYSNLSESIQSIEVQEGDFNNIKDLSRAIQDMEVIINLVCTTLPGPSNENPAYDVESNVIGNIHLLNKAREYGVKKIIFSSSGGTVYGIPETLPIPETHNTDPICSYGITKLAIEKYMALYHHLHDLEYIVLRISNPYGERQRTNSVQGAVAVFLGKILRNEPIHIWGDGSVARDFLYIKDLARAFLAAVQTDVSPGVYNIGNGKATTLNELVTVIEAATGGKANVSYEPARKLDVPVNYLDIQKARKELNWSPQVSLRDGVGKTIDWMRGRYE